MDTTVYSMLVFAAAWALLYALIAWASREGE